MGKEVKIDEASTVAESDRDRKRGGDNNSEQQLESLVKNRASVAPLAPTAKSTAAATIATSAPPPFALNPGPKPLIGPRRTKSMYDHVENDFVKTGKKTHLFRLVVVGSHDEDPTELLQCKRKMIDDINAVCNDECATGFFLAYPRQFIHVLEGSEDTLNNYLSKCADIYENNLLQNQRSQKGKASFQETVKGSGKAAGPGPRPGTGTKKKLSDESPNSNPNLYRRRPRVRMLILGYFTIPDRFLPRWLSTKFNPPRQAGINAGGFRKNLFELVRTSLILAIIMSKQPTTKNGEIDWPDQSDGANKERRGQDMQLMEYLPSQHLIMYVMKDKPRRIKLKTPSEFMKQYWGVPDLVLTNEVDWPIPCRIAPYH